ncbi:MAG: hypothetical protein AMXMBFR7_50090 [Planctomycetota bacterium]
MPITCRFDPNRQVLLEAATDTLTAPALLESHSRRRPHGALKALPGYRAATLHASAPELRMLAVALEAVEAGQKWAWAVVVQDPASFGLIRMLGAVPGANGREAGSLSKQEGGGGLVRRIERPDCWRGCVAEYGDNVPARAPDD